MINCLEGLPRNSVVRLLILPEINQKNQTSPFSPFSLPFSPSLHFLHFPPPTCTPIFNGKRLKWQYNMQDWHEIDGQDYIFFYQNWVLKLKKKNWNAVLDLCAITYSYSMPKFIQYILVQSGFPQALENMENGWKKIHAWKNHGIFKLIKKVMEKTWNFGMRLLSGCQYH